MSNGKHAADATSSRSVSHIENMLDEALAQTFPASDPVAITLDERGEKVRRGAGDGVATTGEPAQTSRSSAMEPRLDFTTSSPKGIAALRHLNAYVEDCGLEHSLLELVRTRASQINGCASCLDMHTKNARAAGETEQRLYTLSAWREAPFFSDRERAALAWTEAVTRISEGHIEDALYDELREHFSEKEIVDLTLAVITINGWNRLAIPFRTPAGSYRPRARTGRKDPET